MASGTDVYQTLGRRSAVSPRSHSSTSTSSPFSASGSGFQSPPVTHCLCLPSAGPVWWIRLCQGRGRKGVVVAPPARPKAIFLKNFLFKFILLALDGLLFPSQKLYILFPKSSSKVLFTFISITHERLPRAGQPPGGRVPLPLEPLV